MYPKRDTRKPRGSLTPRSPSTDLGRATEEGSAARPRPGCARKSSRPGPFPWGLHSPALPRPRGRAMLPPRLLLSLLPRLGPSGAPRPRQPRRSHGSATSSCHSYTGRFQSEATSALLQGPAPYALLPVLRSSLERGGFRWSRDWPRRLLLSGRGDAAGEHDPGRPGGGCCIWWLGKSQQAGWARGPVTRDIRSPAARPQLGLSGRFPASILGRPVSPVLVSSQCVQLSACCVRAL